MIMKNEIKTESAPETMGELRELLTLTQKAAIEVAEERDRLRHCLSNLLRADEMPPSIEAAKQQIEAMRQARAALAEGGK
jgi:hypothetical protein